MEENPFEKFPGLEILLETRSFADLSDKEKEEVLQYMGQDEFDRYHELILKSKQQFSCERSDVNPTNTLQTRLLKEWHNRKSQSTVLSDILCRLITFRVPLYQPAFILLLIAAIFILLFNNAHQGTTRYIVRTDTVFLQKQQVPSTMPQTKSPLLKKQSAISKTVNLKPHKMIQVLSGRVNAKQPANDRYVANAYEKIRLEAQLKHGHTAQDDSLLMRFLVAAN